MSRKLWLVYCCLNSCARRTLERLKHFCVGQFCRKINYPTNRILPAELLLQRREDELRIIYCSPCCGTRFTAAKAATPVCKLELRVWKVLAFVFFIVESILGIAITIWLAVYLYNPLDLVSVLASTALVLTEVMSIVCEPTIIRRKVRNIEASKPTIWAKMFRKFVKYFAFVGCALVFVAVGFLVHYHRSSLGIFMA